MRRFRMSVLGLVLAGLAAGCTRPDRGAGSDEANFRVKSLEGHGTLGGIDKKNPWKVPEHVRISFSACLDERTSRQELRSQPVAVFIPETGETKEAQTNAYGCFNWDENIAYNYYAGKSAWVLLKREILGRGVNSGRVPVEVAVNPWALGDERRDSDIHPVVFMRNGDEKIKPTGHELVPTNRASAFLMGDDEGQGEAQLEALGVRVRGIRIGEGCSKEKDQQECWVALNVEVNLEPKIHTRNVITGDVREPVRDGDFNVHAQILGADIGSKMNRKVLLMSGETMVVGHARDGKLKAEFRMIQKFRAIQGNLEMALKIEPRSLSTLNDKYKKVKPFEGLFRLGAGTQLGDESGTLANECLGGKGCSFDSLVYSATNFRDLQDRKKAYVRPNDPYIFSTMEFRFTSVLPGETATRRAVAYSASTCITDRSTGRPLADTPMKVRYLSIKGTGKVKDEELGKPRKSEEDTEHLLPSDREITTDESGCLRWASHIYHKYYKQEQYFEITISIERETGFKRDFTFYLNPWDDKFTFGWDARELDKTFFKIINEHAKPDSLFFLSDFAYHTVRFMYNIDRFMELEVKKTVLMELEPRVLRYSGIINARKMTEHLRDGIYLLKVAIQKHYLDPRDNNRWMLQNTKKLQADIVVKEGEESTPLVRRQFITTNMALVRVVDGVIIYPMELTMRDLRLMRVRANFMVQLETVDERLIQAFHVFKNQAIDETKIKEKLDDYKRLNPELSEAEARKSAIMELTKMSAEQFEAFKNEVKGLSEDEVKRKLAEKTGVNVEQLRVPDSLRVLTDRRDEQAAITNQIHAFVDLREKIKDVQQLIRYQLVRLSARLEDGGIIGEYLDDKNDEMSVDYVLKKDHLIGDNFKINDSLLVGLKDSLGTNDFSKVSLPRPEEIDLSLFVEKDSGLARRTFVGPVIFLSNGYKDSVRATDNLDEACPGPNGKDVLQEAKELLGSKKEEMEEALLAYEDSELFKSLDHVTAQRLNTAFNYDRYFGRSMYQHSAMRNDPAYGALTHLCYKHVDDMIQAQKDLDEGWRQRFQAMALKYNFLTSFSFDLDYLSLTGEKLTRVNEVCLENRKVESCIEPTNELTVALEDVMTDLNRNLKYIGFDPSVLTTRAMDWLGRAWKDQQPDGKSPSRDQWRSDELSELFFERSLENKIGLCNLLANRISRNLMDRKLSKDHKIDLLSKILSQCLDHDGLVHDIKFYVHSTGDYKFLGGLNLNINVGQAFSVSASNSLGNGVEIMDLVGPMITGAAAAGYLGGPMGAVATGEMARIGLKSLGLKFGTSTSDSEGTSVNESTYLVSQIAKFEVDLLAYERCAIVRLSDNAIADLDTYLGVQVSDRVRKIIPVFRSTDYSNEAVGRVLRRGLMVCEGKKSTPKAPKRVSETYFYFTQHFTEGDMLDQAELYNHPWLLAMRGVRDFSMFINKIRAQDQISLAGYNMRAMGYGQRRRMAWALDHMVELYKNKLPSFPGFYTVLNPEEEINAFPLKSNAGFDLTKEDPDIRGEVIRRRREEAPRALSTQKQFQ